MKKLARRIFHVGTNKAAFREVLQAIGIPCLTAKHDAEELCAYLCKGKVQAVLTKDKDVLAWGCPQMLLDTPQITTLENGDKVLVVEILELYDLLHALGYTYQQFMDFCIMSSCDFNTRVPQLGISRAKQLIDQYKSIENIPVIPGTMRLDREKIGCTSWPSERVKKTGEKQVFDYDLSSLLYQETRKIFTPKPITDAIIDGILPPLQVNKVWGPQSQDVLSLYGIDRYRDRLFQLITKLPDPTDSMERDPYKAHLPRLLLKPTGQGGETKPTEQGGEAKPRGGEAKLVDKIRQNQMYLKHIFTMVKMYGFIICWLISITLNVGRVIWKKEQIDANLNKGLLFLIVVIIPLIEEIVFRDFLHRNLIYYNVPYPEILNALLFGLAHAGNIPYVGDIPIFYNILQIIITSLLGWHLVHLNSVLYGFLFHAVYNLTGILAMYLACKYTKRPTTVKASIPNIKLEDTIYVHRRHRSWSHANKHLPYVDNMIPVDKKYQPQGADTLRAFCSKLSLL